MGIFFIGCGITLYHGVHTLLNPQPIQDHKIAFITLFIAFIIESITLLVAIKVVKQDAKASNISFSKYMKQGSDPMGVAVILEDSAAVLGVLIATVGLALSKYMNNSFWDSIATLLIGALLGIVAIFLTYRTTGLLVGAAMPLADRKKVLKILNSAPIVKKVYDVKTAVIGADTLLFKAKIEFDGEKIAEKYIKRLNKDQINKKLSSNESLRKFLVNYGDHIIEVLGDEIDRLEKNIKKELPSRKAY